MCGFLGVVQTLGCRSIDPEALRPRLMKARDQMEHRGPDDSGFVELGSAMLGFRRLAILDLSPAGHQPMVSVDGQVALVFNGEIYNYQALRDELKAHYPFQSHSDTEVILAGYLEWGWEKILDRLDGMFAIALWDHRTQTLYAARDRVGKKPFFYRADPTAFYFASTLNALVTLIGQTPPIEAIALDAYLTYQALPSPLTIYQNIQQLPPAHQLVFQAQSGRLEIRRYWQVTYDRKVARSEAQILADLDDLIHQAVRKRLVSDVPLGAFLSGGVDSSLVTAVMAQEKGEPIDAIVIGFEDPAYDERSYARQVAQHLGDRVRLHEQTLDPQSVMHLPEMIWHYGQPLADVSIVPTYYVAKAAKQRVTVVLNGDGGDEVFAGYTRPIVAGAAATYRAWVPAVIRRGLGRALGHFSRPPLKSLSLLVQAGQTTAEETFVYDRALRSYRNLAYSPELAQQVQHWHPDHLYQPVWQQAPATDEVDRALYGDFSTYLPDQLLTKMDVSTMAWSVEARSPLLDLSLIEYAATIPTALRIKGYTPKYLLKQLAERYVPAEVLYRRKRGFVMPAAQWVRGDLLPYVKAALQTEPCRDRGWIRPEFIDRMLLEHQQGQRNWGEQIWTVFVLEIWARLMLDHTLDRTDSLEALL